MLLRVAQVKRKVIVTKLWSVSMFRPACPERDHEIIILAQGKNLLLVKKQLCLGDISQS